MRRKVIVPAILAISCWPLSPPAAAQCAGGIPTRTIRYEACVPSDCASLQPLNFHSRVAVPKFDPALGNLQQVRIEAEFAYSAVLCLENTSSQCCSVVSAADFGAGLTPSAINQPAVTGVSDLSFTPTATLTPPGFMLASMLNDPQPGDCAGADGTCSGGSGYQATVGGTLAEAPAVLSGADLDPWIAGQGGSTVVFDASADGTLSIAGCASLVSDFAAQASLRLRVVYTFCPTVGTGFCAGDGSGTACPCGNQGPGPGGCLNSSGSAGLLQGLGSASVGADDLALVATGLLPSQPALLFVGQNAAGGGLGLPFGDGLRCVGGGIVRLGVRLPDSSGAASWGPGLAPSGGWNQGDVRRFQVWYRDPSGSPCGFGFNLSNGLEVVFTP